MEERPCKETYEKRCMHIPKETRTRNPYTRPTHIEKRPTHIEKRPTHIEKRPAHIEKRPTHIEKRPTRIEKRPTRIEKRPTRIEKRPPSSYTTPAARDNSDVISALASATILCLRTDFYYVCVLTSTMSAY